MTRIYLIPKNLSNSFEKYKYCITKDEKVALSNFIMIVVYHNVVWWNLPQTYAEMNLRFLTTCFEIIS